MKRLHAFLTLAIPLLVLASSGCVDLHGERGAAQTAAVAALPARLSDAEFWSLVTDISEPGGYFRISDNFTSNEREIAIVSTMLRETRVSGGVYIGVGPEQNFSYIAAIRPDMAFIVDIRRQAVMQHLMFKAIFEMAPDRADFVSLLFSKPRPPGLGSDSSIQNIWQAFTPVAIDVEAGKRTYARIVERLAKTHRFPFTAEESEQLQWVFDAFQSYGPSITTRGGGGYGGNSWTFADLTGSMTDSAGATQSFLSTEDHYRYVKMLQDKNLIVPVSGDFGGPKAIRAIGAYLRDRRATVSAFYVSNVEQYLFQDGKQKEFFDNVTTLPITPASVFIRPYSLRSYPARPLCPIGAFVQAFNGGRIYSNNQALACAQ